MKIAFCYKFCTMGGCETVLSTRLHALRSLGVDAHAFFLKGGDGERLFKDLGDRVSICPQFSDMKNKLSELQPDFLLSLDTPQVYHHVCRDFPRIQYVYEVHTPYSDDLKRLKYQSWRGVSAILTPTHAHREVILSLLSGKIDCPVQVVPNPLRSDFNISLETRKYHRPILIWVGRLDPHKNWRMFIEICNRLNSSGADMEYWIVGTSKTSPMQKVQLWKEIKKANLASRFRWLPCVEYEKMDRLYRFAAGSGGCLVYTSLLESFGMAAAEAMANACPVVVPDIGGFRDFVINGVTGFRYAPGDSQAAVNYILKSVQDIPSRTKIVMEGYQRVQNEYSAQNAVQKLIDTLQNLKTSPTPTLCN
jgi:glycosyltransferase involved in cell wall biosynthesis